MARERLNFRPGTLDLIGIRANDRNHMQVTLKQGGVPWDTTGAVVAAQARTTANSEEVGIEASVTEVDTTVGQYVLKWAGADVATLLGGAATWDGVWDLQVLESGQDEPETVLEGVFQAESDVTRP